MLMLEVPAITPNQDTFLLKTLGRCYYWQHLLDTGVVADPQTREEKITRAVEDFLSALGADPYNVHATYNLAAAYARIGRKQCALNLLVRLIAMKDHHSRKVEVASLTGMTSPIASGCLASPRQARASVASLGVSGSALGPRSSTRPPFLGSAVTRPP